MEKEKQDFLLKEAIDLWGHRLQIEMAIEELGELIVAIQKYKRHYDDSVKHMENRVAIVDEIADVTIMMKQLRIIFGEEVVDARESFKMNRLEGRIVNDRRG